MGRGLIRWLGPAGLSVALLAFVGVLAGGCGSADGRDEPQGAQRVALFVQLLRPEEPIVAIDVATGERTVARGLSLAGGDPLFRLVRTGNRLVYYGSGGTYAIDLDLQARPQKLGAAWYFLPSAREGRVWLAFLDPNSPVTVRGLRSLAEVTVRGRVTARSSRPPPCRGPSVVAAAEGALVCQGRRGLKAFDSANGEVLERLPGPFPLDTHGPLLAWCGSRCPRLHITDIRSGRDMTVAPGQRFRFEETYEGAFSPDGSLLAAPILTRRAGAAPSEPTRRKVALIDVSAGTAEVIAGSRLAGYRNLAWSSSGRWLFLDAGRGRIMAYRPSSGRATLLPLRLKAKVLDMAAS